VRAPPPGERANKTLPLPACFTLLTTASASTPCRAPQSMRSLRVLKVKGAGGGVQAAMVRRGE